MRRGRISFREYFDAYDHLDGCGSALGLRVECRIDTAMDNITQEIENLRGGAALATKKALIRWCVRWSITAFIILWAFPRYPLLWCSLFLIVPLGALSLYSALSLRKKVEARCAELLEQLDGRVGSP